MGRHSDALDARAREALADARRKVVLGPQVQRAKWQVSEAVGALVARVERHEDEDSFWDWPEVKQLQALLNERAS